jgi:hypothetical protein
MKFKFALLSFCIACAANAEVEHNSFGPIKIGERAKVIGNLTDNKSIEQARLYFKSNLSQKFSFTELDMEGKSLYASLPAPGQSMLNIEYFFAVKYGNGELEQTSVYSLNIDREWDAAAKQYQKSLSIYSELDDDEGDGLLGFVDNLKTVYQYGKLLNEVGTAVELASYSNYTVVAGSPVSSGAAVSSASAATTASSGLGVLGWTGIGLATVAGGALAAGSSSDDDDDDGSGDFDTSDQSGLTGQEGVVRVFLSWNNSNADLDLHVTDPCGNVIGFQGSDSASCQGDTGVWDVDAIGVNGTEENITWPNGAPNGSYSVQLNHFGGETANYTIEVFYGNSSNSFSGSISEDQFPTITTFNFN